MAADCGELAIVDDDATFRGYLEELLNLHGYATKSYESGEALLRSLDDEPPPLVLLDVHLGGVSGYEVSRAIRERFGDDVAIIFVSGVHTDSHDRATGLLIGGDDYIVKPVSADELIGRIRRLLRRVPLQRLQLRDSATLPPILTPREQEILELLAEGKSQKEISLQLFISPHTVATHIQRILSKLQVHSRAEAVGAAFRLGLVGSVARGAVAGGNARRR